ncbi:MAG: MerR family DNA-binding protein [Pseudomonadota bacterium]
MRFTVSRAALRRGGLASRTGCNSETIRYYETIGLLPAPARSQGGHRLYTTADQRRLRFLLRGRGLGFSIAELRSLLSLVDSGEGGCGAIHGLTMAHLETVRAKIADLQRLERTLAAIAADCADGTRPDCPIIEALQEA